MSSELDYQSKISAYGRSNLLELWNEIEANNTSEWQPGKALEYLILRAFQLEGAEIRWPFSVNMEDESVEQIDGVIYSDGIACLVECKDQTEEVNVEPIAKLRNQLLRRPTTVIGSVFSRTGFTNPALILARFITQQPILLWGRDEIAYGLENEYIRRGLVVKYRHFIEHGEPNYNIRVEKLP